MRRIQSLSCCISVGHDADQMKLQWIPRDKPVEFEEDFLATEPSIDFEKTLLGDCSKGNYFGGKSSNSQ